jgi:hypothetical protein
MKKLFTTLVVVILVSLLYTQAPAGVPEYINYQGKLTDANGGLICDTSVSIGFGIYADSTGGTALWDSTYGSVQVKNGLFSVLLGPIPDAVFNGSTRYLGITVGSDSESTPRMPIVSVGYAYRALRADTTELCITYADSDWVIADTNIYRLDGNVGIGTATPSVKLDVRGTVNVGVNDTGYDVNFYGAESGSRVFWDESKMAFRAGRATGDQWNDANTGIYSFASGLSNTASGEHSVAMGGGTTASGDFSTAMGGATTASAEFSTAMGVATTASGYNSTAMGNTTTASGEVSTAMGIATTASGNMSTAIGVFLTASADNSIVMGTGLSEANRLVNNISNSLAVGFNNTTPTLFVDGSKVGIGTTSPIYDLDVNEDVRVQDDLTVNGDASVSGGLDVGGTVKLTPDFDTTVHINAGSNVTVTHGLGGDPTKYVVLLYGISSQNDYVHQKNYGTNYSGLKWRGCEWGRLNSSTIRIWRAGGDDTMAPYDDWYYCVVRIFKNQ